ncbi:MAG: multidrug ABC transporter, partial [Prochlorococcaceae cyanobacterium]
HALPAAELHQLLVNLSSANPAWSPALRSWPAIRDQAQVRSLPAGSSDPILALAGDHRWFISSGGALAQPWRQDSPATAPPPGSPWLRLVGLPPLTSAVASARDDDLPPLSVGSAVAPEPASLAAPAPSPTPPEAPVASAAAPAQPPSPGSYALSAAQPAPRAEGRGAELRLPRATGPRDGPIAICLALARYFGLPVNRDALIDQVNAVLQRQQQLNLINLGQLLDAIGMRVVLSKLPLDRLQRVATPAVVCGQGHFAILEGVNDDGKLRLLEPELGPLELPASALVDEAATEEPSSLELLLLERKPDAKEQRFSWSWFWPFVRVHRRQIVEVVLL